MRKFSSFRPGLLILALAIAIFLWGIASGTDTSERGFDIPVELNKLTEQVDALRDDKFKPFQFTACEQRNVETC